MTDRLQCPDCGGKGETLIGSLRLACLFCQGLGYVGDDNEPAERGHVEEDTEDKPLPPWWEEPGMDATRVCRRCFGAGVVVTLGGDLRGGVPTALGERPCPECSSS